MLSALVLLAVVAADPPLAAETEPPRPIDTYPLRASERPLTMPAHLVIVGLNAGVNVPGPYGPAGRTIGPSGGLLLGWSFAEGWEWYFPLYFVASFRDSDVSEHAFSFGVTGVVAGLSSLELLVFDASFDARVRWRRLLREGVAFLADVGVGAGYGTRLAYLSPSMGAALTFDLSEKWSVSPHASLGLTFDGVAPAPDRVLTLSSSVGGSAAFHPLKQLDLGLNIEERLNPRTATLAGELFLHFRF